MQCLITVGAAALGEFRVSLLRPRLRGDGLRALQEGGQAGGREGDASRSESARRERAAALRSAVAPTTRQSTISYTDCSFTVPYR